MNLFRFQSPWWLAVILPLAIVSIWRWITRRRRVTAVTYSSVDLLLELPNTMRQRIKSVLPLLWFAGVVLLLIGLARPQSGEEEFRVRGEGIAIQMCLDRSGSMLAKDFVLDRRRVNRLEAVKHVFRKFVAGDDGFAGRPDDAIGLISFGGFADAECPQTLDHGVLLNILESVEVAEPIRDSRGRVINEGIWQEEQATAIGDAVALAVDRLKNIEAKSRVIILLSDGENTAGIVSPEDAAKTAKTLGIKIYTIGVGTTGMAPFEVTDMFGRTRLESRPVKLDERSLRMLADTTGGSYFSAQNVEALQRIYDEIDKLEKTEIEGLTFSRYHELYPWFLLPAVICLCVHTMLNETWRSVGG